MRILSSVLCPAAREFTTMEEEPESVVNTALSVTFSDSRVNKMLLAATFSDAFFMRRIRSKSSPA